MTHVSDSAQSATITETPCTAEAAANAGRKPYQTPSLQVFGSVRGLTEGSAGSVADALPGTMRMMS